MARNNILGSYIYVIIEEIIHQYLRDVIFIVRAITILTSTKRKRRRSNFRQPFTYLERIPAQVKHMHRLVGVTNTDCMNNLRMDRNTFGRLCHLLRQLGQLSDGRYVSIEEQVAMFLGVLSHHKKNRVVRFNFQRSGQTVSFYVHEVMKAILKLHRLLLVNPKPVPEDCTDPRWRWFKGCLGALDGTYINVFVANKNTVSGDVNAMVPGGIRHI